MYNFDEHNRMVDRHNANREISRPSTSRPSYYSSYDFDRHNDEVKRYYDNREVKRYPVTD